MKLEPLLVSRVDAGAPIRSWLGTHGTRLISTAGPGTFEGERLRGKVLPNGGDWILVDNEDVWHMDVRLLLETEDSALIYVQYHGLFVMNETMRAALAGGGTTSYGDGYFMIRPRFETGDPRYRWLNRLAAVGEGRLEPSSGFFSWLTDRTRRGALRLQKQTA